MNLTKKELGFCILENPFEYGGRYVLFISESKIDYLKEGIVDRKEYQKVYDFITGLGLMETDYLTFEPPLVDANIGESELESIKKALEKKGFKYNEKLEKKLEKDFDEAKKRENRARRIAKEKLSMFRANSLYDIAESTKQEDVKYFPVFHTKHRLPSSDEKITLHFYLFLTCLFKTKDDFILDFSGDFLSNTSSYQKNFIKIIKADFIKLRGEKHDRFQFQSVKTHEEFLKEIGFLHKGVFGNVQYIDYEDSEESEEVKNKYVYSIMEVKDSIDKNSKIVFEVSAKSFDSMIEHSNSIKKEYTINNKSVFPVDLIKEEAEDLKEYFDEKMQVYANEELFEKAGLLKKDINFVDKKIKLLDKIKDEDILISEYEKKFNLS